MDLGDIIDLIVDQGSVTLEAVMPANKESTRVVLTEKFKRHCELLDSVGYLPVELEGKTLSFKYDRHQQQLTVSLKDKRQRVTYSVLGHEET